MQMNRQYWARATGYGLLALALLMTGCKTETPKKTTTPATASVAAVTRGDLSSTLTVAGIFQPYQEVEPHAKISGFVRRINVDIGDKWERS